MASRMRIAKEEPPRSGEQTLNMTSALKELHRLNSRDLYRLIKDSGNGNLSVHYLTEKGVLLKVDMGKLAQSLPLHLTTILIFSRRDEDVFQYVLCGIRLLHSLCELASRLPKFDQIFLNDVKVVEQLIDLVFYMLIILSTYRQEDHAFRLMYLSHSALLACSLHLITGFISTQFQDIATVLLAHPKVDLFIDAAFGSVRVVVRSLEITLMACYKDFSMESNLSSEQVVYFLCQQCEASLQFIQSLCQQKSFRERLLNHKELCEKGSILFLAQSILKLNIQSSFPTRIVAGISRLKAKILSILLSLCEAENISYLDQVAASSQSLNLAKSVALEVLDLLKTAFGRNPGHLTTTDRRYPIGLLQLNAMRLADIFSDDTYFRSCIIVYFTKILTAILSLSHVDFLSTWCSSNLSETEEDASVEYDLFATVGWIFDNSSSMDRQNSTVLELNMTRNVMPSASYAHHRTSLFVKVIANLHCFVPDRCEEKERNLFVRKVLECLQMDLSNLLPGFSFASDTPKAATVSKNLRSLLNHAQSLMPNFLDPEDLQILRVFFSEMQTQFTSSGSGENHVQEAQCIGIHPLHIQVKEPAELDKKVGNLKEGMSENSAFPSIDQHNITVENTNISKDLNRLHQVGGKSMASKTVLTGARDTDKDSQNAETSGSDNSFAKSMEHLRKVVVDETPEDEKVESLQRRKRKRIVMNDNMAEMMDSALLDEPEDEKNEPLQKRKRKRTIMNEKMVELMERALLDEPEMQRNAASLQSWAEKLSHLGSEITPSQLKNWLNNRKAKRARTSKDNPVPDKQKGPVRVPSDLHDNLCPLEVVPCNVGQSAVIVNSRGEEIGKGKVVQLNGKWYGKSLEELGAYVMDVYELHADTGMKLPFTSEATGTSFAEAERKLGSMRVLWDSRRILVLQS
ncbi:nodulin homeobox-like isoform X1 [Vicia villosa]|uniref:nodulin homeobox-like isoform X1 n=1 Tax=Vicia villosa TaxID=3911 RepID=UPI00273A83DB|nr:nodulin homeobox-like isoform X1 [Vicia villosa]